MKFEINIEVNDLPDDMISEIESGFWNNLSCCYSGPGLVFDVFGLGDYETGFVVDVTHETVSYLSGMWSESKEQIEESIEECLGLEKACRELSDKCAKKITMLQTRLQDFAAK